MDSQPTFNGSNASPANRSIACFDLDDTLVRGDTCLPFLASFAIRRGGWWKIAIMPVWLVLLAARIVSARRAKQALVTSFLGGRTRAEISEHADWFFARWVRPRLNPPVVAKLQEHLAAGQRTLVVSASPDVYVPALARHLGVAETVCTRIAFENDLCTGRIVGENCKGYAKVAMLQSHLGGDVPCGSFSYSDSVSDLPLFRATKHATLVQGEHLSNVTCAMKEPGRRNLRQWALPLVCVAIWAALIPAALTRTYKYTWDSAAYVEATQSIVRGDGVMHRVIGGVDLPLWEPMSLWPPGYPLMIASLHSLGLPAPEAGVAVSLFASGVFVLLQAWLCSRFLGPWYAAPVAIAVVLMPELYQASTNCLSDAAYMALSAASLAALVRWSDQTWKSRPLLAIAGFLAGAAWATRMAGAALLAAEAGFLALYFAKSPLRVTLSQLVAWGAGAAVPVLAVLGRNLATFGTLNPYTMPPSNLTLLENLQAAFRCYLVDLVPAATLTKYWTLERAALICVVVAAIVAWSLRRKLGLAGLRDWMLRQDRVLLLFGYAALFISLIVAARTKYWWGEDIYWRYLIPTYWIALIGMMLVFRAGVRLLVAREQSLKWVTLTAFLGIVLLQTRAQVRWLVTPPATPASVEAVLGNSARQFLVSSVPSHQIVLSDRADLLRLHCDLNARKIPHAPFSAAAYRREVTWQDVMQAGRQGHLWGVVLDDVPGALRGAYGPWLQQLARNPADFPELEVVPLDGTARIFRFTPRPEA